MWLDVIRNKSLIDLHDAPDTPKFKDVSCNSLATKLCQRLSSGNPKPAVKLHPNAPISTSFGMLSENLNPNLLK